MKYSAINIGPIISTFGMARKPRELWAASYLFSHLMKCIYASALEKGCIVVSPAKPEEEKNKIGIYPDRIFIKDEPNVKELLKNAKDQFCKSTKIKEHQFEQYFNLMSATCEAESDSKAIGKLNQHLDVLELCNYAADRDATIAVRRLIAKTNNSPLFLLETGNKDDFPYDINTLAEIATAQLQGINPDEWKRVRTEARNLERQAEKRREAEEERRNQINDGEKDNPEKSIDINEDYFYKGLMGVADFKDNIKSHHKYFCVVQADGDNVGKTVSHESLQDGKDGQDGQVQMISKALVQFGQNAAITIENYGGLPIYAGGDDLLFIAPVIGKDNKNIFDLIKVLESESFSGVVKAVHDCNLFLEGSQIEASLSFGISISYYKYPLYEAFEKARNLLFGTAKEVKQKKAVAWSFRKHSGGTFEAAFSLKDNNFANAFAELIKATTENTVVSAVAHKIRDKEALVKSVMKGEKDIPYLNNQEEINERPRLDALFDKVLEFQDDGYFKAIKTIMPPLYETVEEDKFIFTLYSLLRTAKFIKGEGLHDEE